MEQDNSGTADEQGADVPEDKVRRVVREELREELAVSGPDGREWSMGDLMDGFDLDRRTTLQALGLVALGFTASEAIIRAVAGEAEAATDDLTVPGTATVDALVANSVNSGGPLADGDGVERKLWEIAEGDADPAGAAAEDWILEFET